MSTSTPERVTLALTPGEPAGIGPELVAKLIRHELSARIVVIADRDLLAERARAIGLHCELPAWNPDDADHRFCVLHVPTQVRAVAGQLDAHNSGYVLETIERAVDGCLAGTFDGMVTGPVHKGIINEAGFPFTGHTEMLAERCRTPRVVMMLAGGGLRVALATTHLPLKDVASELTPSSLEETLRILAADLTQHWGIERPRIAVAGLNPHAGESGYLGREEIEVIAPVLERLRAEGMALDGPIPADTLFTPARLAHVDAVLSMYHDQGLPVLKYASFGRGINVTLGLPIIRTSVDHGTALDLAGTGKADESSLVEAIEAATSMAMHVARSRHASHED
jgi:4-hydroxythreonine-4-phosphate dehydrogenase